MTRPAAILATLVALAAGPAAAERGPNAPHAAPPADYAGQWYTTPDGCSYSRAQAPGYAPTWHLIVNPHHIGQPAPHRGCPGVLRPS